MSQLKMEAINNLSSCLKILEKEGFEAEHRLLVQLFGCMETYWNRPDMENLYTPKDSPETSSIEEGEIKLSEDDQDLEENVIQVKSEEVPLENKQIKVVEEKETSNSSFNDVELEEPYSIEDLFSRDKQHQVEKERRLTKKDCKTKTRPNAPEANQEVTLSHCNYCFFKLPRKAKRGSTYFKRKLREHNKTEHFVCVICRKNNDNKDGLDEHMNSLHIRKERLICGVNGCDRKMKRLRSVLKHIRVDHNRVKIQRDTAKSTLSEGGKIEPVDDTYISLRSGMKKRGEEKSEENVARRNRIGSNWLNPEVTSSHCKYCPFKIPERKYFKTILRMHNKTEHFVCEICRKKHDNKDELDEHVNSLHNNIDGSLTCGVNSCKRNLKSLNSTLSHIRFDHDRVADMICKECNKPYMSLKSHRIQHHRDPSSVKTFKTCTVCGSPFKTNNSLLIHTKLRHPKPGKFPRKLPCGSCDFETGGLSRDLEEYKLIMHKRIHQNGEIICTMCPHKSGNPWSLKRHLAEEHNIGHVFQCNQCDYRSGGPNAKIHMTNHMNRHLNEKNFQCDQCEFSGNTNMSLNQHLRRHKGPKYFCDECDYKSTESGNFRAHKQVKHGSVLLSCEECDYSTKSRRSLREHKKKHLTRLNSITYQERLELK